MSVTEILSIIVPLIAVILSYICGRLETSGRSKTEAIKEQYEKFYIPFLQKLCIILPDENIKFSDMSFEMRSIFFDIVMSNIQYIDINTQHHIPNFYCAYVDMLEYADGNPKYAETPSYADIAFINLAICACKRSIKLSKKLHFPKIGAAVLPNLLKQQRALQQAQAQKVN